MTRKTKGLNRLILTIMKDGLLSVLFVVAFAGISYARSADDRTREHYQAFQNINGKLLTKPASLWHLYLLL